MAVQIKFEIKFSRSLRRQEDNSNSTQLYCDISAAAEQLNSWIAKYNSTA